MSLLADLELVSRCVGLGMELRLARTKTRPGFGYEFRGRAIDSGVFRAAEFFADGDRVINTGFVTPAAPAIVLAGAEVSEWVPVKLTVLAALALELLERIETLERVS